MLPPIGSILVWPSASAVPTGWQKCDGTNGTPDLADKTVPAAGGVYAPGDTGGSFTIPVPSHSHSLSGIDLSPTGHGHVMNFLTDTNSDAAGPFLSNGGDALKVGHEHTGSIDSIYFPGLETDNANGHGHDQSGWSLSSATPSPLANVVSRMGVYFIQRLT